MSRYRITFTPSGPYFFGGERNLKYPGRDDVYGNLYYVRGESMPSQTTILGAIRFVMLELGQDIGPASFDYDAASQEFGVIKKVSPVYLVDTNGKRYIPLPFDHNTSVKSTCYTPLKDYGKESVETLDGKKLYAGDFNVKEGVTSDFVCIDDGNIVSERDVFSSELRVGINRREQENGFFKREFKMLGSKEKKFEYSFAVSAELDVELNIPYITPVYMGQGKTAFSVRIEAESREIEDDIVEFLSKSRQSVETGCWFTYCFGDCFVDEIPEDDTPEEQTSVDIYKDSLFAITKTRENRTFKTVFDRGEMKFVRGENVRRLIRAGSVFLSKDNSIKAISGKEFAKAVGFNHVITIGGKQ